MNGRRLLRSLRHAQPIAPSPPSPSWPACNITADDGCRPWTILGKKEGCRCGGPGAAIAAAATTLCVVLSVYVRSFLGLEIQRHVGAVITDEWTKRRTDGRTKKKGCMKKAATTTVNDYIYYYQWCPYLLQEAKKTSLWWGKNLLCVRVCVCNKMRGTISSSHAKLFPQTTYLAHIFPKELHSFHCSQQGAYEIKDGDIQDFQDLKRERNVKDLPR